MAKLGFALRIVSRRLLLQPKRCPYCGSRANRLLGRRRHIMDLRRCDECALMFRYPLDSAREASRFYEDYYTEGAVTDLPEPAELARLREAGFTGSPYDFTEKIRIVKLLRPAGRVLDYGCSWGYHTYQLQRAGFEAVGFEMSGRRRGFAREELGVEVVGTAEIEAMGRAAFDVVIANHMLEHLPGLAPELHRLRWLLRAGGLLVAFVPNGGGRSARQQGASWGPMIGEKHLLAFDRHFFEMNLPAHGFDVRVASDPYDLSMVATAFDQGVGEAETDGDELMVLARVVSHERAWRVTK